MLFLHGIMSTIGEFYFAQPRQREVSKAWASRRPATGGTNGKAPVGYLNVTKRDELGREAPSNSTPRSAPLVKWAFEAYATGNHFDQHAARGTVDRPRTDHRALLKRPGRSPALSTIQKMLCARTKGNVLFRGATYDGLHEPLVAPGLVPGPGSPCREPTSGETCPRPLPQRQHLLWRKCGSRLILSNRQEPTR
ncbi:MAG: hypothetical protein KIT69_01505 [Propionibacteriaceae bacterium]|nr:hypothetical protein [Propionibacteriaceae bacterium]